MVSASTVAAVLSVVIGIALLIGNKPPVQSFSCFVFGRNCPNPIYAGTVAKGWEPVVHAWMKNFHDGYELGTQITIYHKNKLVVDLALGYTDETFTSPYSKDTLQLVFSSTKVIESLVIAMLVDRGLLNYSEPVATYWPEFAANGKAQVTVGDLMSHGGGITRAHGSPYSLKQYLDDRKQLGDLGELLAASKLDERVWRGKGAQGYHALVRGLFSSHLVRRVDPKQRTLGDFAHDEIFVPLGIDRSVFLGLPEHDQDAVRRTGPVNALPDSKLFLGFLPRFLLPTWLTKPLYFDRFLLPHEVEFSLGLGQPGTIQHTAIDALQIADKSLPPFAWPGWRAIESPSTHGFATADALARIANALAHGGEDPITGTRLLSAATLEHASTSFPVQFDNVLLFNISYTQGGFGLLYGADATVGWGGAGGSLFQWHQGLQLAYASTVNYYAPHIIDWRAGEYLAAAMEVARGLEEA